MKLAMIMLAAGNSRRFGGNKLLYEIDGMPMYERILRELQAAQGLLGKKFPEIVCSLTIVTQYQEIMDRASEKGAKFLVNPHPEEGISSSLKIGLRANMDADAALFTVSDQPWLKAETICTLAGIFLASSKRIACPAAKEEGGIRIGNPCLFSKEYFSELLALTGDTGGKKVIKKHLDETELFFPEEKKELEDIDCPLE